MATRIYGQDQADDSKELIDQSTPSYSLLLKSESSIALTQNRSLTFDVNEGDRLLNLYGDASLYDVTVGGTEPGSIDFSTTDASLVLGNDVVIGATNDVTIDASVGSASLSLGAAGMSMNQSLNTGSTVAFGVVSTTGNITAGGTMQGDNMSAIETEVISANQYNKPETYYLPSK